MNLAEILAAIQTSRALYDLALTQFSVLNAEGALTEDQKRLIIEEAELSDGLVDDAVEAAKRRIASRAPAAGS